MKKLICFILGGFLFFSSYGQAIINRAGAANTVQDARLMAQYNLFVPRYADTTSALSGTNEGIDSCGAIIFTYDIMALWFRSCYNGGKKWVQILPNGGGSGGTLAWVMGGNNPVVSDGSGNSLLGPQTNNGISFISNNLQRVILPSSGLSLLSSVSDTTANKVMTFNPSTKIWGYSNWYGGGSGSTPTWQQTLTAGSTLNTDNTVDGGGHTFNFVNNNILQFGATSVGSGSLINLAQNSNGGLVTSNIVLNDSILLTTTTGKYYLSGGILNVSSQNNLLGIATSTGQAGRITIGSGLSLSSGVLSNTVTAGANTALSNLASVAINTSLLPGTDNSIDLGSTTKTWRNEYVSGAIAIGSTSTTFDVDVRKTTNGSIGFGVQNASSGTSAAAVFQLGRSYGADFYVSHYYAGDGNTVYTPLSYNIINAVGSTGGMFFNNIASATMGFLTANTTRMTILGGGNVGIGDATPASLFTVGSGDLFQVNSSGDVVKLKNVTYSWPSSNSSGVLLNNGSGTLSWTATSSLSGLPYVALTGTSTATGDITLDINGNNLYLTNTSGGGEFLFYDAGVNEGVRLGFSGNVFFKAERSTNKAYIYSNAISGGSAGDALTIANPSTGELTVAPNLAFNLKKEGTMIYANNGRIFAEDNSGNKTQISPHNEKGEWIYKSTDKSGITTEINMIHLAELLEKVTGEKLIYKTKN